MRVRFKHILILFLVVSGMIFKGCMDLYDQEKYKRPDWLVGKLYTQLAAEENLTKFAECLRLVGLDTIIDVSGSFTVFAPSDEAVDQFLAKNQYADVKDIPKDQLEKIVRFHIIQNPWSIQQLQMLDIDGWIDPSKPNDKPWAYKRQTILKNKNEKYWLQERSKEDHILMDSSSTNKYKLVYTRSRKFVPIFFDEFLDISNLSPSDYSFYFNREYEPGNIYYAEGKVIKAEIFAENGFIHVIDRVVNPMLNAKEILERNIPGETYNIFLEMVYQFYPQFEENLEQTYRQPAAKYGGTYDTLHNLSFPSLPFDLHEEMCSQSVVPRSYADIKYTYSRLAGMHIPTDQAFGVFVDETLTAKSGYPHWPDLRSVPRDLMEIIVIPHFTANPVYYRDISKGFIDGEGTRIFLEDGDIKRAEFGSNCTFLGLNKLMISRVFTSVSGPVYLRPQYSLFRYAMQYSGATDNVSTQGANYFFFPIPDVVLNADSSLILEWTDFTQGQYRFRAYDRAAEEMTTISSSALRTRIQNQVGTSLPNGSANKEFIRTIGGNYIIWNNSDNTASGTKPNTYGYNGSFPVSFYPEKLEEPVDNGEVWRSEVWFSNTTQEMYAALSQYKAFTNLLKQAGLYNAQLYQYTFLNYGGTYTIFIPSEEALTRSGAASMPKNELANFLKYHFVSGQRIFTDNKLAWKNYPTLRVDETSTPFNTYYSYLNIKPGQDSIQIIDTAGIPYVSIAEAEGKTNIMISRNSRITAVIHEINAVLTKQ